MHTEYHKEYFELEHTTIVSIVDESIENSWRVLSIIVALCCCFQESPIVQLNTSENPVQSIALRKRSDPGSPLHPLRGKKRKRRQASRREIYSLHHIDTWRP